MQIALTLQKDAQAACRDHQHHCEPHFFTFSGARIMLEKASFADADSSNLAEKCPNDMSRAVASLRAIL